MLRSMADSFELNAAFLSVPTQESKEQSPPALLFLHKHQSFFRCYAQSAAEGILNRFYLAASNSASISAEGAGVTRLTTTQTTREIRKAGSSS